MHVWTGYAAGTHIDVQLFTLWSLLSVSVCQHAGCRTLPDCFQGLLDSAERHLKRLCRHRENHEIKSGGPGPFPWNIDIVLSVHWKRDERSNAGSLLTLS